MKRYILLIFALFTFAIEAKRCEDYNTIEPIKTLNYEQFSGDWYVIKRVSIWETLECEIAIIEQKIENGTEYLQLNYAKVLKDERIDVSKEELRPILDGSGAFLVAQNGVFTVLSTDYDAFAVLWYCRSVNATDSIQNMWILSRDSKMSIQDTTYLDELITSYGFNVSTLATVNHNVDVCGGRGTSLVPSHLLPLVIIIIMLSLMK